MYCVLFFTMAITQDFQEHSQYKKRLSRLTQAGLSSSISW